jgi:hypothetical protein
LTGLALNPHVYSSDLNVGTFSSASSHFSLPHPFSSPPLPTSFSWQYWELGASQVLYHMNHSPALFGLAMI